MFVEVLMGCRAQAVGIPGGSYRRGGVWGLQRAAGDTDVHAVLSGQRNSRHVRAAIEAICAEGAVKDAMAAARAYARRAQEALSILPDNASRQTLHALAEYVVARGR
jgi:geranylgeranyl pyrophosphate synthase